MISGLSLMFFFVCICVAAAFMPPAESMLLPPVIGFFSTRMTFAPASWAVMAAVKPAAPAPTITMSVESTFLSLLTGSFFTARGPPLPGIGMLNE